MSRKGKPVRAEIFPKKNEPIESLIRRFVKKVKKEGIIEAYKKNQTYTKPSDEKRAIKNRRRRQN